MIFKALRDELLILQTRRVFMKIANKMLANIKGFIHLHCEFVVSEP